MRIQSLSCLLLVVSLVAAGPFKNWIKNALSRISYRKKISLPRKLQNLTLENNITDSTLENGIKSYIPSQSQLIEAKIKILGDKKEGNYICVNESQVIRENSNGLVYSIDLDYRILKLVILNAKADDPDLENLSLQLKRKHKINYFFKKMLIELYKEIQAENPLIGLISDFMKDIIENINDTFENAEILLLYNYYCAGAW